MILKTDCMINFQIFSITKDLVIFKGLNVPNDLNNRDLYVRIWNLV